jgi:DNA-binding NarL/FixJ family response regulator
MKRLVIVADHALVADGIRLALRQTTGFQIAGFIDGRVPAVEALRLVHADVVLVDEMRNGRNSLARLREAAAELPDAKRVLLTLHMDPLWLDDAFRAGADAVVSKSVHQLSLGTVLREVVHGNVVHRPPAPPSRRPEFCGSLTLRELDVLRLVATGHTNGQIARELKVTEQTVKFHLSNTYRKLGVVNRTEAGHLAHVKGLLEPHAVEDAAFEAAA